MLAAHACKYLWCQGADASTEAPNPKVLLGIEALIFMTSDGVDFSFFLHALSFLVFLSLEHHFLTPCGIVSPVQPDIKLFMKQGCRADAPAARDG